MTNIAREKTFAKCGFPDPFIKQRRDQTVPNLDTPEASGERHDRKDTRLLGVHVKKALHRDIKLLAAREGTTVSALLHEAFGDLFKKKGSAPPSQLS
jgi:hypothetical protein